MKQQEEIIWVDQGWPKAVTTVASIIDVANMPDTTPERFLEWVKGNAEYFKTAAANEILQAFRSGHTQYGILYDTDADFFTRNYEK